MKKKILGLILLTTLPIAHASNAIAAEPVQYYTQNGLSEPADITQHDGKPIEATDATEPPDVGYIEIPPELVLPIDCVFFPGSCDGILPSKTYNVNDPIHSKNPPNVGNVDVPSQPMTPNDHASVAPKQSDKKPSAKKVTSKTTIPAQHVQAPKKQTKHTPAIAGNPATITKSANHNYKVAPVSYTHLRAHET